MTPARGAGGEARADLPQARAHARTTTCSRSAPAGAAWRSTPPRSYGCRVTTTTISREQHALARRARARRPGWRIASTVLLEDYRDLRGRYDKLVSIEMIEAVGWQYFDTYFRKCADLLGRRRAHAAPGDHDRRPLRTSSRRRRAASRTRYVFPAGCLPSLEVIRRCARRARSGRGRARGPHRELPGHAQPLAREASWRRPTALRSWATTSASGVCGELYLSWSEGGFRERRIQDYQVLLAPKATATGHGEVSLAARG